MMISQRTKTENWFIQHKLFSILLVAIVIIGAVVIFKMVSGSSDAASIGTAKDIEQAQSSSKLTQSSAEQAKPSENGSEATATPTETNVADEMPDSEESTSTDEEQSTSQEYEKALKAAQNYSDMLHMSKKTIYDQLISDNEDHFSPEAAQYAVDNITADFKQNALLSAQSYREMVDMSSTDIFNQLTSDMDQFTPEEAQYAIDNLA